MDDAGAGSVRKHIRIEGVVQGVGFRPFVYNLAVSLGIAGFVGNDVNGVNIEAEGTPDAIADFERDLIYKAPPLAHITAFVTGDMPITCATGFSIRESRAGGEKTALVAPDFYVCDDCLREMFDPNDRRHRYPFINCVNCGPRFTIVTGIPYDRPNTTMAGFEMCADCRKEYDDPANRRFHAQPIACPVCGPKVRLVDNTFNTIDGNDPVRRTVELLAGGRIVAIKGIGGYHLVVDAENHDAVMTLRKRKRRDEKPFAVMAPDVEKLRLFAELGDDEISLLTSGPRPITLARKVRPDILPSVAPSNVLLGAMLPYTPLHHLLFADGGFNALVMTSANISDDPIVFTEEDAVSRLGDIADYFLVHDRPIHTRADDSIERVMSHGPVILRRSRGYTPTPVKLDREYPTVLAVGGELKNTFCVIKGDLAFLSQHIGDLKYENVYESFKTGIDRFLDLLDVKDVDIVAYDMHPRYLSSIYAGERPCGHRVATQHHHAHLVSLMVEKGRPGDDAIGVIFDGTGYGDDGAIWGGEFLIGSATGYERFGTLCPLPLPGGDKAIKEPYRIAFAALYEIFGDDIPPLPVAWMRRMDSGTDALLKKMIDNKLNTPLSHGAGRLFDAVSAMTGLRDVTSFEGQAAMELEYALAGVARDDETITRYTAQIEASGDVATLDFRPVLRRIADDVMNGVPAGVISLSFHESVARGALEMVRNIRDKTNLDRVYLSGGVFQNGWLSDRLGDLLQSDGFEVHRHNRVPPNDGGISLGQAVIAGVKFL